MNVRICTATALLGAATAGSASAVSLTIDTLPSTAGLGVEVASLTDSFATPPPAFPGIAGTVTSRVFVDDPSGASVVTFVYELEVTGGFSTLEEFTIEPVTPLENDLRITEILAGSVGNITAGSDEPSTAIEAFDNAFPVSDSISFFFGSVPGNLEPGESAVVFIQTTGDVDFGTVTGDVQNFGGDTVQVLAPVDDPSNPDLSVPEPASLALLGLGGLAMAARRRR